MEENIAKWLQDKRDRYKKVPGVEYDINARWEQGVPHHHKSVDLYKKLAELDFLFLDDYFCFKSGGDGDNGGFLMYLMDIAFEEQDLSRGKNEN